MKDESINKILDRLTEDIFTNYKGCIIHKIYDGSGFKWAHGSFIGTLQECKNEIDKNILLWSKTITP